MNFDEIKTALKDFESTEDFNNYIAGILNDDRVNSYLDTDAGKKLMQPKLDSYFNKGLETWKKNNLDALVGAKVKELYPDADPKDQEIAKIRAELERITAESKRKDLTNQALTIANAKGLPADLVGYFIGEDEKSTNANLNKLEKSWTAALSAAVTEKLKDGSYTPPDGESDPDDDIIAAFKKINPQIKF